MSNWAGKDWLKELRKKIKGIPITSRRSNNFGKISFDVANFIKNRTEEIKIITAACGESDVHKLNKGRLRALNSEIAKLTKIELI